ncbi:16S rRNA (cytidine(1402)-2'-O)-methyltransferase [Candidatus Amoebophilus asiaticus]|nr:16S rRNA (cytidine(1402)-2'-O)-methyltransferase [Candidatus Amoebophilus asiaticus]
MTNNVAGKLYLVPTPIGNLKDITLRALEILKEVDLILAEDTRKTKILLNHFKIACPSQSHHQHNEHKTVEKVVEMIRKGKKIAMVTDAGTPGISDPGFLLVRECIGSNIPVECLPGATAFIPAIIQSGIPCNNFSFEGFLPAKKGRQSKLQQLAEENKTMVFYESPHRLLKTLRQFIDSFGEHRQAAVARELTKIHEETIRGSLKEILEYYQTHTLKGEIVIILAGKEKNVRQ